MASAGFHPSIKRRQKLCTTLFGGLPPNHVAPTLSFSGHALVESSSVGADPTESHALTNDTPPSHQRQSELRSFLAKAHGERRRRQQRVRGDQKKSFNPPTHPPTPTTAEAWKRERERESAQEKDDSHLSRPANFFWEETRPYLTKDQPNPMVCVQSFPELLFPARRRELWGVPQKRGPTAEMKLYIPTHCRSTVPQILRLVRLRFGPTDPTEIRQE